MCRLYGFRSTEPTRVECSLVHAQNSLLRQSQSDEEGTEHPDGWGIGAYLDPKPFVERSTWAAYHDEQFGERAARTYAHTVIAHVRDATTGVVSDENTHPFQKGQSLFAHNGTVKALDAVRKQLLEELSPSYRDSLRGTTDSELVFSLVLSLRDQDPKSPPITILRHALQRVIQVCREIAPKEELSLNTLWTNGKFLVGSRLGRSLWYVTRQGVLDCEICGFPHIRHDPREAYRAVVVASEPLSQEQWIEVPEESMFSITEELDICIEPLWNPES